MIRALVVARSLAGYPGYLHKVRALILGASVLIVTLLALAAAAVPAFLHETQEKVNQASPAASEPENATFLYAERGFERLWSGNRITRIYLSSADPDLAPSPPGVQQFPGVGEVYLSPRLRELARSDDVIAHLLDGYTVVGDIAPAGLAGPQEARGVFGLSFDDADRLTAANGYGASGGPVPEEGPLLLVLGIFLTLLVLVPTGGLVLIAAKLGEAERGDRGAVLRMLGAPRSLAGSVAAYECALVAAPAGLLGVLVFRLLSSVELNIPFVQVSDFPGSLQVSWWATALIVVGVVTMHCAIAARVTASGKPSVQPLLEVRTPARWPVYVLGVSLVLLAGLWAVSALPPAVAGVAFFVVVALIATTLAFALPAAIRIAAARAASWFSGAELYGARVLSSRALPSIRLAALTSVLVVALGIAVPFLMILKGGPSSLDEYTPASPETVVTVPGVGRTLDQVTNSPGVELTAPLFSANGLDQRQRKTAAVAVLVATCSQARELLEMPLQSCSTEPDSNGVWLNTDLLRGFVQATSLQTDGPPLDLPSDDALEVDANLPVELSGVLLLQPDVAQRLDVDTASTGLVLRVRTEQVDTLLAQIAALAPWAYPTTGDLEFFDPDQRQYPGTTQVVLLAATTSLILAALMLLTATLGEAAALNRRVRPLIVLGAPRTQLLRLHATTTAVPILFSGTLATAIAYLAGNALHTLDDRAVTPPLTYSALLAGTVLLAATTFLVSTPVAITADRRRRLSS